MKPFELRLRFPAGSMMIGGYSPVPLGTHAAHAIDAQGRPIIPATALRGALRESLEAILRGVGESVCSGGDGQDPETAPAGAPPIPCILDHGRLCRVCRLFGSRRANINEEERAFSGLVLGAAVLAHNEDVGFHSRPGVSISRQQRSAKENRLYLQRLPATPDTRFKAEGILVDPSMENLFAAAVRATTHIGAGRSRGLARVEIEPPSWRNAPPENTTLPGTNDIRIRVTLMSPASIGAPIVHPNLRGTRHEIPGAAVRGAIGFALAGMLEDPNHDDAFQRLVSEQGARFGFLHPVDAAGNEEAGPIPMTSAACKEHERGHGLVDTLFDQLAVALVQNAAQMEAVERDMHSSCNVCRQPLRAQSGWRRRTGAVPVRQVTRVSLDRRRASARDEFLFSQMLLEPGTVFEGVIHDVPADGRDYLARALSAPLSLGRGRSSGWGRISVDVLAPPGTIPLSVRGESFQNKFTTRLERAKLPVEIVKRLVTITLMSPLLLDDDGDGENELSAALGAVRCVFKARRFSREGGWDQRGSGMQSALAVSAGGVFVFELDRPWREALDKIEDLERRSIGQRRHQGYGRVLAFDPMFHEWMKRN